MTLTPKQTLLNSNAVKNTNKKFYFVVEARGGVNPKLPQSYNPTNTDRGM